MALLPRRSLRFVVALTLFAALLVFALPITAQDATSTPEAESGTVSEGSRTICDSTTVLLLLLAERDYGFQSDILDLSTFEFGQFQAEFDALQTNNVDLEAEATEEAEMSATEEMEATTSEDASQPAALVTLLSAIITGENPQCALLRQQVEEFLWEQIQAGNPGGGKALGTGEKGLQ